MQAENASGVLLFGLLIVLGPLLAFRLMPPMSQGVDGIPIVILILIGLFVVMVMLRS
jgi:hypothetical protein